MAFINKRLSDRCALGFQAKPFYCTRVISLDSGVEKRNICWTKAKRQFSAVYTAWNREMLEDLLACFHACRGAAHSFRFKDWTDFSVTMGVLPVAPSSDTSPVQLVKYYDFDGEQQLERIITKPVSGTVTVYQSDGSGNFVMKPGSIDLDTGEFTPDSAWTAGRARRATFEFDTPVRFASDELPGSWDNKNLVNVNAELLEVFGE